MARYSALVTFVTYLSIAAVAAPPGPIDGSNIPSDFAASKRVGVQTNYTGVGDVTGLTTVSATSDGSELDAVYLAKDSAFLYVGIAGNLLPVGNPFIILIDNPFDFGQTELRTEGVDGPPFALQLGGREVVVNDGGTPGDETDDTFSVNGPGTLLPDCGDPGFTGWDFALAIDSASGVMFAHEYQLFDIPIGNANVADTCHFGDARGRVPCDPTPSNPNDGALQTFAFRNFVASSPLGDGNEAFEGGQAQFGYPRGGFDNSNVGGVTETSAADAASVTTGVEIAIPLANIGSGLFSTDSFNMMIVTMEVDEFDDSAVSGQFGQFLNQTLPSLSGAACNPASDLGLRPDLSVIASCLQVDLTTIDTIAPSAVLEGVIVPGDYDGGAPVLVQQCPTSGGDQTQLPDIDVPATDGSELNQLFADNDDQFLYLGLTGNLAADGTSINLFIDADNAAGGDGAVSDFEAGFTFDGTFVDWDTAIITEEGDGIRVQSTDQGGAFKDISPNLDLPTAAFLNLEITANGANQADVIRVVLTDSDGTERAFDFAVLGPGDFSFTLPLENFAFDLSPGSSPGLNLRDLSFFQVAGGFNNDPALPLDVTFKNISLTDSDGGEHVLDFQAPGSAFVEVEIENFNNFTLGTNNTQIFGGTSWDGATFTSGPTNFTISNASGFGGGFFDINPNIDLTGADSLTLDVTVNAGSSDGTVTIVLADTDDTQKVFTFFVPGPGSYSLTRSFADAGNAGGGSSDGVFDFSEVSFAQLQSSFVTTDFSFENASASVIDSSLAPVFLANGNELPNGPLDVLGGGTFISDLATEYDFVYALDVSYMPSAIASVNFIDLVVDSFAFRGAVSLNDGSAMLGNGPGGATSDNPNGMQVAFDNTNTVGVVDCLPGDPCFSDTAAVVAAEAETATTGVELAIPLADLGLSAGDLPQIVQVSAIIGDATGATSNQMLPTVRNQSFEGNQLDNPGRGPLNLTVPESGPSAGGVIDDFSNFVPTSPYGTWPTGTFTAGVDDFRVEATDFGGLFFDVDPNLNLAGASNIELDVTLNPANQATTVIAILHDGDGTIRVWRFDNLTNGQQTLSKPLSEFASDDADGTVPGFDTSDVVAFNIAGSFGNGNPGLPFDVTFDELRLTGGTRNFEARSARICLGTIVGDGDCDGDNDLADIALLQQCLGLSADPVFGMECEQLNLITDTSIDDADAQALLGLLTGP